MFHCFTLLVTVLHRNSMHFNLFRSISRRSYTYCEMKKRKDQGSRIKRKRSRINEKRIHKNNKKRKIIIYNTKQEEKRAALQELP